MITWLFERPVFYELNQKNFLTAGLRRRIRALLLEEAGAVRGERVIDVGCGTGLYIDALQDGGIGTDINLAYLRFLRRRGRNVFAADARCLALRAGSAAFVYCINVLHHVDDVALQEILREMWRVCSAGGKLFVLDIVHPPSNWNLLGRLLRRLDRGAHIRRREEFKALVGEFTGGVGAAVAFTDFCSYPHDVTLAVIGKDAGGAT